MVKKLSRGLFSFLFKFFLYVSATAAALILVFAHAKPLKTALKASGVYDTLVSNVIKESAKQQSGSDDSVSLSRPEVAEAAKQAFTPVLLQRTAESVIDGVYNWADGSMKTLQISVDLGPAKQAFASAVGDKAAARLKSLPVCTRQQLQTLANSGDINPFTVSCLPPGLNIDEQRQSLVNQIANNKEFLGDPVITANNLPKDAQGRTVEQRLKRVPQAYQLAVLLPWVLGASGLLCGAVWLLLFEDKRKGSKAISTTLIGTGVFLLVSTLLINFVFNKLNQSKLVGGDLQAAMARVAKDLSQQVNRNILVFGGVYLGLGLILFAVLKLTAPKHLHPKDHAENAQVHTPDTQPTPPIKDTKSSDSTTAKA